MKVPSQTTHNLYVVLTSARSVDHHGLHTTTSKYLLARFVRPGDSVVAVLEGLVITVCEWTEDDRCEIVSQEAHLDMTSRWQLHGEKPEADGDACTIIIRGHLGRAVMLGEDGAEDAFGHDVLAQLWLETLSTECPWAYAPVDVTFDPSTHSGRLRASRIGGTGGDRSWVVERKAPKPYEAKIHIPWVRLSL